MNKKKQSSPVNIDLHALDAVLDAFATATSNPANSRTELYENFHRRVVACTDSLASAVFSKGKNSQLTMVAHYGWSELGNHALAGAKESIKNKYLQSASLEPDSNVATFLGKTHSVNDVEYLFVLVRHPESDALVRQVFEDLVQEIANQIETYEVRRAANQKPKAVEDLAHLAQLIQNIAKSQNLTQLATHLVNDFAKSTGADRVCFFRPSGKLLAVSGVSQAALKTTLAKNLSRLARLTNANGQPIESTENQVSFGESGSSGQIRRLIEGLDSDIVYLSPLAEQGNCVGVISVEYFDRAGLAKEWTDQRNLFSQTLNFVTPVVSRAVQVQSIPGIGVVEYLFNRVFVRPLRSLCWTAAVVAMLLLALYFLLYVERPFEIHAEGTLQPVMQRNVFSPRDGEIKTLFVAEGTFVDPNEQLAVIESRRLLEQLIVVEGEQAEAIQELQNLKLADSQLELRSTPDEEFAEMQTRTASDIERWEAKLTTLDNRQELLKKQAAELTLRSPIGGQVTTPDVDRRLASRPVDRGDLLMTISALDGAWEIALKIPDNRVEFINAVEQPTVRFRIAADSEKIYTGKIREIDFRAQDQPDQNETCVRALVDFDERELADNLRLGSRVIAKVDCGKKNNLFLLTYELRNKIRAWFFF